MRVSVESIGGAKRSDPVARFAVNWLVRQLANEDDRNKLKNAIMRERKGPYGCRVNSDCCLRF